MKDKVSVELADVCMCAGKKIVMGHETSRWVMRHQDGS